MTAPEPLPVRFPPGCRTRRIDPTNRVKVRRGEAKFASLLGWADGVLDTVIVDGWLTLTQRPEQVGAPRGRNNANAGFSITTDSERILLRPAHLVGLGMNPGDEILTAVVPDHRAVVMYDPNRIVPVAPTIVARMLGPDTGTLADDIENYLALQTAQTRRTYRTALHRLRDGLGPVCDQTCEQCLGKDFVCRCECAPCVSSRVSLPALGAERVSAAVYSANHAQIIATASKRIAIKKGIVDNRRRAERGKPPKAADGYGAEETAVSALRSLFERSEKLLGDVNPALEVRKPHRISRERRPLQDFELCSLYHVTSSGGDDPELDTLILDVSIATGARREGVWALTVGQIDPVRQLINLRDKYKRTIPAPVSADLIERLLAHAKARGGANCDPRSGSYRPDARVLWTKPGRTCTPISDRRFDTLASRWQKTLPWANAEQLALHHIRHTMAAVLAANFGPHYKSATCATRTGPSPTATGCARSKNSPGRCPNCSSSTIRMCKGSTLDLPRPSTVSA